MRGGVAEDEGDWNRSQLKTAPAYVRNHAGSGAHFSVNGGQKPNPCYLRRAYLEEKP